ncbi:DUF167 domain-containing protein [Rubripirellula reticaptiva]|uniref:UPF0235 protein Poly59_26860 n=1 Tax=Rubripirellula reticaptiva TaxID=2528013 RepID=A0A5C6ESL0_9BACT|nr:DUF167 domain-containing protein [Rubripirellula reticaptiva]TWU51097.1 hypothetical protein Poly59_26860 [Rubripirellula reticaptiva]
MRISIHATASARQNHVGGCHDDALRVSVTAVADKGKANKAIAKALSKAMAIKPSQIELIGGQTNRRKVFQISDPPVDLAVRIEDLMNQS